MLAILETKHNLKLAPSNKRNFSLNEVENLVSDAYWNGRADQAQLGETASFNDVKTILNANGLENHVAKLQK